MCLKRAACSKIAIIHTRDIDLGFQEQILWITVRDKNTLVSV